MTSRKLCDLITQIRKSSLRSLSHPPSPTTGLVCFPWCGAGASAYRKLASELPLNIELLAVQLPGREDVFSHPPLRRMNELVHHVLGDIVDLPHSNLSFFGHSFGALFATETALALKIKTDRDLTTLVVSGSAPPISSSPLTRYSAEWTDDQFVCHLAEIGGTPPALLGNIDAMRALLPAIRADYEALETYRFPRGSSFNTRLVACAGDQDAQVPDSELRGWRPLSTGEFITHTFPGDHFYLNANPRAVAAHLARWLLKPSLSEDE